MDIKPDNIMVERNAGVIYLIDYQCASDKVPSTFGTIGYIPPEYYKK